MKKFILSISIVFIGLSTIAQNFQSVDPYCWTLSFGASENWSPSSQSLSLKYTEAFDQHKIADAITMIARHVSATQVVILPNIGESNYSAACIAKNKLRK